MQWFIDIFGSFFSTISSLVDFAVSAVKGLVGLIAQIPTYLSFITDFFELLPPVFSVLLGASISITIIFLALGRGQGGD